MNPDLAPPHQDLPSKPGPGVALHLASEGAEVDESTTCGQIGSVGCCPPGVPFSPWEQWPTPSNRTSAETMEKVLYTPPEAEGAQVREADSAGACVGAAGTERLSLTWSKLAGGGPLTPTLAGGGPPTPTVAGRGGPPTPTLAQPGLARGTPVDGVLASGCPCSGSSGE